jgi:hypothetical protein
MRVFARLAVVLSVLGLSGASAAHASATPMSPAHYDHVFVVVEENHGFTDVIGNSAAPNLNALAQQYGLATNYFGVGHPSEPNYVGLLGGSTFGIASDDPYWVNRVDQPNLISELDSSGISWKAYLQGSPHPGYEGICYPSRCNGSPDVDPLYVSKHDGIQNYTTSLNAADWARQVPDTQLATDLGQGNVPSFGYVIPDECHDMHGDPPYCIDGGDPFDAQDQRLVTIGDRYLGNVVHTITAAPFWAQGNNAVVVTFDEGDDDAGCCGAPGGGQVATIVITSHGVRGSQDATAYSHFSLLRTIQQNFALACLQATCDTTTTHAMDPLFAVTGSTATAFTPLPVPDLPTPTPTPDEPVSLTTSTPTRSGWHVVPAPVRGTNDNSLGAVAASGLSDAWAVGNFIPDTPDSNPDATLSLAAHFDGSSWNSVPTPNIGPNFTTLFGVASSGGQAWAVGVGLDSQYRDRALIEHWDGHAWAVVSVPQPGDFRDILFGASATSPHDVWAVGEQQAVEGGPFATLVEHYDGHAWSVTPTPNPGTAGNHLYGVVALAPDNAWAVGQQLNANGSDGALIEHWNGSAWSVTPAAATATASANLVAVAADGDAVYAVGKTEDPVSGARPLVERFANGHWSLESVPATAGSLFSDLWGVTVTNNNVWAVGAFVDPTTDASQTLILRRQGNGIWHVVNGPNPGPGDNILGGIVNTGDTMWAVGTDSDGAREPLIERHPS